MVLGETGVHDTTVLVAIITAVGLIAVALIGVWQIKVTSQAKKDTRINADAASKSAEIAADYAAALEAKKALISSLESRLEFLESQNQRLIERLDEVERRNEEYDEQQRAASLLERNYAKEIDELRAELDKLKARQRK